MALQHHHHQQQQQQQQAPGYVYPPAPSSVAQSYPSPAEGYGHGPYVAPPPPMGYPTKDSSNYYGHSRPVETINKGDGFLKGCLAALCCCWVLDVCIC